MPKAILVRYRDCFNCHSCEVACQMHNDYAPGQGGVKVNAVGPWEYAEGKWEFDYVPFFTQQCDLCAERSAMGKLPSCVQHCEARCLEYGDFDELAAKMGPRTILQTL